MHIDDICRTIDEKFTGKAISNSGAPNCSYLNSKGQRCAIGLFIPDGHDAQKNANFIVSVLTEYPDLRPLMPFQDVYKLMEFQRYHDNLDPSSTLALQKTILKEAAIRLFT